MSSPHDLPGELKQKRFAKALSRLGFEIDTRGGDGSHFKAVWPRTQKTVIIPAYISKQTLRYLLKEIQDCSGLTWEQIREQL